MLAALDVGRPLRETAVKMICFLFLVLFVAAVGLFAYQNNHPENVTFANQTWELPFPAWVGIIYLLGMLTGWTILGLLRRSWRRVSVVEDHRSR